MQNCDNNSKKGKLCRINLFLQQIRLGIVLVNTLSNISSMKKIHNILILSLTFMMISSSASAQAFDNVKTAIKIGSSKELSAFFDNNIEITVDGKTSNYSKAQGEFVVKDFFKTNPPIDFKIIHNGKSEGGLQYAIGTYTSSTFLTSSTYRVLIRLKGEKVYNLSFTKE